MYTFKTQWQILCPLTHKVANLILMERTRTNNARPILTEQELIHVVTEFLNAKSLP